MTNKNDKLSLADYLLKYGQIWENYGKRRIYFNNEQILRAAGYEAEFYKTGNLKLVRLDGDVVSNSAVKNVLGLSYRGDCFYDLESETFNRITEPLVKQITKKYMDV